MIEKLHTLIQVYSCCYGLIFIDFRLITSSSVHTEQMAQPELLVGKIEAAIENFSLFLALYKKKPRPLVYKYLGVNGE